MRKNCIIIPWIQKTEIKQVKIVLIIDIIPDRRSERDGLIAATALVHGLVVVTRNTKNFEDTGAELYNPWEINQSE
ncbi:hypothetical protein BN59_03376 [Legionella massiliensis]|uniref:Uncharacterized protein n=1 Tax=Legionella massiliensis TaxID=1034943 RepID=A0A078KXC7_9GAMM|nr:hypothetical protein BN59_03376 [Legionella massiliensis]CEE14798.1 hypothetical protein BN1094_03376 [Legionella massiliensis]